MSSKKETFTIRPFEKLRKTMERAAPVIPPLPSPKRKEELTEDELFNSAMDDVQVIEAFRALSCTQSKKIIPQQSYRDPDREAHVILDEIAEGTRPINLPDTQEYVEWTNPEYGRFITEYLHEGRFSVQTFLDLHGYTVREAEDGLEAFLEGAFIKGLQCVKIIHGRGLRSVKGPRIKDAVIRRLLGRYRKQVIAFVSARQCDGGLGAIYVLLAKR